MPHYKDGQEAKLGDYVEVEDYGQKYRGVVTEIQPGNDTCNLYVGVISVRRTVRLEGGEVVDDKSAALEVGAYRQIATAGKSALLAR